MTEIPMIPEFYRDKTVFITGGSGFMGKVLIEKLLRSCPNVKEIYLLMRPKKNCSPEERLTSLTNSELFDLVRKENSKALKKVKFVNGDVKDLKLGISNEDWEMLVQEVNVVFHVAASVRFDNSLTDAILMNTRGTREVVNLALQARNLDVFVHVSTTYCHTDKEVIEEKIYPPHGDWRKSIEIAENVDKNILNALTDKYISPLPNTYTYTKGLAEQVVNDLCLGRIPAVIYRPSIVVFSYKEPFPGWIDGLSGAMAYQAAVQTGLLRIVYGKATAILDCVPVDASIKAIIIASWAQATLQDEKEKLTVNVYNGSNNNTAPVQQHEVSSRMLDVMEHETPFDQILWYPRLTYTTCYYNFKIQMLLYQVLPALLIDGILRVFNKKPFLTKLQKTIHVAMTGLAFYILNEWSLPNEKTVKLQDNLHPDDIDSFHYYVTDFDMNGQIKNAVMGIKKYLLKETFDLEKSKKRLRRMKMASQIFNTLWYLVLFWLVFMKFNVGSVVSFVREFLRM